MKQKIKVVLARSAWDGGETSWKEHKVVEIEVDNVDMGCAENLEWHVVGEIQKEAVKTNLKPSKHGTEE